MANFDTLKALIAGKIHDNTEQEITAADVRDSFDETIDAINGAKQDTISNLATIEAGAAAGATAVQPGALATVATSGNYADLSGKPTIPAAPGTLQTDLTAAQSTSASEALSGAIKLHKVSKTGDYGDLNNKPTIPAAQVNADWNAGSGVAQILNKPTIPAAPGTLNTDNTGAQSVSSSEALSGTVKLHKISKTGSYADLNNKPTIPSISLNGSTTTSPSFYAPTGAGTLGQVLTSNGSGAPTWQNSPSGGVQDVTVGGTSVVSGGVAEVPAIPAAPGTLDTTATTAQATNASEALSGSVKLHKVAKTGTYSDLIGTPSLATVATSGSYNDLLNQPTIPAAQVQADWNEADNTKADYIKNKPTIPTVPTISTDVAADKADNSKTTGAKAVYDFVKPAMQSSQPAGGMLPGVLYNLGTLTGSVTVSFAAAGDASVENEYKLTFDADSTAPTITWPNSILGWAGNCLDNGAPLIAASKHYEVSVIGGYGIIAEF